MVSEGEKFLGEMCHSVGYVMGQRPTGVKDTQKGLIGTQGRVRKGGKR